MVQAADASSILGALEQLRQVNVQNVQLQMAEEQRRKAQLTQLATLAGAAMGGFGALGMGAGGMGGALQGAALGQTAGGLLAGTPVDVGQALQLGVQGREMQKKEISKAKLQQQLQQLGVLTPPAPLAPAGVTQVTPEALQISTPVNAPLTPEDQAKVQAWGALGGPQPVPQQGVTSDAALLTKGAAAAAIAGDDKMAARLTALAKEQNDAKVSLAKAEASKGKLTSADILEAAYQDHLAALKEEFGNAPLATLRAIARDKAAVGISKYEIVGMDTSGLEQYRTKPKPGGKTGQPAGGNAKAEAERKRKGF